MKLLLFFTSFAVLSCTPQYSLVNTEFHDLAVSGAIKQSNHLLYRFDDNTYSIEWLDIKSTPKCKYIIEEGTYTVADRNIVLSPEVKVFCEIFPLAKDIPCPSIANFDGAHFINRDTLKESDIIRLGFHDRTLSIITGDD